MLVLGPKELPHDAGTRQQESRELQPEIQGSTEPLNIGGLPPDRAKWGGGCAPSPFG